MPCRRAPLLFVASALALLLAGAVQSAPAAKAKSKSKKSAPAAKKAPTPPPKPVPTTLDGIARAYRDTPSPATRSALERFAQAHPNDEQGALAFLALANVDLDQGRPADALPGFLAARKRLPKLADIAAFGAGRSLGQQARREEAIAQLDAVIAFQPPSPYRSWALPLAATYRTDLGDAAGAIRQIEPFINSDKDAPVQPQGLFAYARALEASGNAERAVPLLHRIYSEYPSSPEAASAAEILLRLSRPAPAATLLKRAEKLMQFGDPRRALIELQNLLPSTPPDLRDLARVRIGAARYFAREYAVALDYLRNLKVAAGEPDAERIYYLLSSARRLDRWDDVDAALAQIGELYPKSRWRLEALVSAANRHLVANAPERYLPIYQACAANFADDPQAAFCHWRAAWVLYSRRDPEALKMFAEHLQRFPRSPDAAAALYFLARARESNDPGGARVYYEAINKRFPNFYYAMLARKRLAVPAIARVEPNTAAAANLSFLNLPDPRQQVDFTVDPVTQSRMDRARLLQRAGLTEIAELELRFGARTDSRGGPLAVEAAQLAYNRGDYGQSIRYVKALAPNYLSWSIESAPMAFWKLAYPLPYRASLEHAAAQQSLDPYLMAGLIRQESEFDRKALSRAKAMGLTQIMPGTGREISRRVGIAPFTTARLYEPEVNLKIGTYFLRNVVNSLSGNWEAALAAYNAGPSRARLWLTWGDFREPAEFIETIPFHETRDYVQIVMRNADMYRRLYGKQAAALPSDGGTQLSAPAAQTVRSSSRGN